MFFNVIVNFIYTWLFEDIFDIHVSTQFPESCIGQKSRIILFYQWKWYSFVWFGINGSKLLIIHGNTESYKHTNDWEKNILIEKMFVLPVLEVRKKPF